MPQCSHIYVLQFRSCCSPNRNPVLEDQLTGLSLYYIYTEPLEGTWFDSLFHFLLSWSRQVLICRYVDADSQRYSYKNVIQIYSVNSHKRIPARTFLHKFTAFSLQCNTDCTTLFSLTELKKNITGCLNSLILWYL